MQDDGISVEPLLVMPRVTKTPRPVFGLTAPSRTNSCFLRPTPLVSLLPVGPVELGVDSSWVNSRPVVVLGEELLIHAVL